LIKIQFRKNLQIAAVFLLLYTPVYSQKNFKSGYVILKIGDTLHGKINYQNWRINPLKIQFQKEFSITTYTPATLNYFEITGVDSYVSRIITKDMRPVDILTLSSEQNNKDTSVTDIAFLRILVNGTRFKLYGLSDRKDHYYIQGVNGKTDELLYKKYTDKGNMYIYEQTIFRNQLAAIAEGTGAPEEVQRQIEKSHYTEKDLVLIVRMLNGEDLITAKNAGTKKKSSFQVLAGAGIQYYSFKFTGDNPKWTRFNFANGLGPVANIALEVFSERNLQKISVRFEFSYSHLLYKGEYQASNTPVNPTQFNYNLVQNNIIPAIDVLYHFVSHENFKLYGGLGLGFVFSSYPVNEYSTKNVATGSEFARNDEITPEKFWMSPNIMFGARIRNKINLGLSTKFSGGFFNYNVTHGSSFPITLIASYIILPGK
jgi:hypothetical protein